MSERPYSREQAPERVVPERVPEQVTYTNWQYVKATFALPLGIASIVLILVGFGVLAVAAWTGLSALIDVMSRPCFTTSINTTTYAEVAGYLSGVGMMVSGIGIAASLLLLAFAGMNENMHHAVRRNLGFSVFGLLTSAAIVPLTGVMGCVVL